MGVTAAVLDFTIFAATVFAAFILGGFAGADMYRWRLRRAIRRTHDDHLEEQLDPPGEIDHQAIANILADHRDRRPWT